MNLYVIMKGDLYLEEDTKYEVYYWTKDIWRALVYSENDKAMMEEVIQYMGGIAVDLCMYTVRT